jgi:hypothetical protein
VGGNPHPPDTWGEGTSLYISPLNIQIAYKLRLGSGKDIEDAKFPDTILLAAVTVILA